MIIIYPPSQKMASPCHSQQCSIERRGFRQELDSWRHKLIHCVGFESILEGLFGPRLLKDISLFEDCEPTGVSDWSFDENCLFCCLRREKVKEHLVALDQPKLKVGEGALSRQEQAKINRLEKQAEEFLNAVFQRKDSPRVADPSIPLVAREIMHRMIRQFAAEYTSKTSTSQDSIVLTSTKDQSASKTPVLGASALNPVLSKLLMADQDSPLDLTVKKSISESDNQDGVLDLSTKKSPCASKVSSSKSLGCSSSASLAKGRPGRAGQQQLDCESQSIEGALPKSLRSIQTMTQDNYGSSVILKIPVTRSAQKGEEPVNKNEASTTPNLGPASQHRGQHLVLAREAPWAKPHYEFNLEHVKFRGNDTSAETKEPPVHQVTFQRGLVQTKHDGKKDQGHLASVDLKIPQVRGMDLSYETNVTNHYTYSPLLMNSQIESALHRKLRVILPKQNLWHRKGVVSLVEGGHDSWGSDVDQPTSSKQQATSDIEGDSKQPRKKRGRYRQYNNEILEEAITVVMSGKMSVSKAQSTYGIPHSTLEYKVKERLGTLKNPPKKKLKLLSPEPQELDDELEHSPSNSKVE
ncbi:ligand-dependent corepressor-like [Heptranchias perlo]|uniref:ligand-dependent corepressor-like n=1 Tax=Heptranchias perlo TaxID=212740 RepID=UPI0035596CCB